MFSHRVAVVSMEFFLFIYFFPSACAVSIIIYRQCDRFILHANEWKKRIDCRRL